MRNADVPGHRTRSSAVYFTIANEMISKPLINNVFSYKDVLTVIEMKNEADCLFYMEPITWNLFNKLVDLFLKPITHIKGNGNYIPSLIKA